MLDKTSSIICAFGLASAAPRSPYRHLELCGIALIEKTARTTAYHTVYGQLIYHYLLFSQVWVDKRNPTWYPSRVRVSTG
ncbi:MAG: hypothetical protein WAW66_09960 [Gemmiger qucibialis]